MASIDSLYGTPEKLADYAHAVGSGGATVAINGQPYGVDTLGGVVAYEFGFMSSVAFPLMGILLVARWTRGEEQSGRLEMVRAGAVSRSAPLAAAAILATSAFLATVLGFTISLTAFDINVWDALSYSTSMGVLGLWFAAVTGLVAQVVERTRAVLGVALIVLVLAFVLRGIGDVRDNALTWLSPLGWAEETRAFADTRWWPLAIPLLFVLVIGVAAFTVVQRRDLGSGMLAARPGPTRASAMTMNSIGLAVRMHRNIVTAWAGIAVLVGAAFGSLTDPIEDLASDNSAIQDVFGGDEADAFLAFCVLLIALIAAGFALQTVGRMSEEERGGRLEPLLAGSLGRVRWLLGHLFAIGVGAILVALVGGVALGVGVAGSTGDSGEIVRLAGSALAYGPSVLTLGMLAVALYALRPALRSIGWVVYALVVVVAMLGDTLQLDQWVRNLSPIEWVGRVPDESVAWWAVVAAGLMTLALSAFALAAIRRRDVPGA